MNNGKIALQLMTLREVTSFGAKGLLQIREIKDKKIYGVDDAFRMVKELGISYLELSKISVTDELAEEMAAACRAYDMHTVSYTHLRAHETRHDLVCRLLLEKKKLTAFER